MFLFAFGRLKPDVSLERASANLKTIFAQLERAYPADNKGEALAPCRCLTRAMSEG